MLKALLIGVAVLVALGLAGAIGVSMYYERLPAVQRDRIVVVAADDVAAIPLFAAMQRAEPDRLTRLAEQRGVVDSVPRAGDGPFGPALANPAAVTFAFDSRGKRDPFASSYKTQLVVTVSFVRTAADVIAANAYYRAHARLTDDNTLSSYFDQQPATWTTDGAIAQATRIDGDKHAMVIAAPDRRIQAMALWRDGAIAADEARVLLTRIVAESRVMRDLTADYDRSLAAADRRAADRRPDVDAFLAATGASRVSRIQMLDANTHVALEFPLFPPRDEPIGYAYVIALGSVTAPLSDSTTAAWQGAEAAAGDSALWRVVVTEQREGLPMRLVFAAEPGVGSDRQGAVMATWPEVIRRPGEAFVAMGGVFGNAPKDHAAEVEKLRRIQAAAVSLVRTR
ncbi:MAG: hypothetical protein MUF00_02155 [Gemmatimonadaceae bacterium]|jgi:hypothetical protein|nr:hypothetical protein [Gemmatimonadaceae bacterium]